MPKLSVIIPNYNHARYLRQRIDTVLAQTFQDFEVILLDDCSTDESCSIIAEYATNPKIRTEFNDANSGSTFKQWNKGVRLAQGQYVWIAESDDYSDEHFLRRLVHVLDADPKVSFVYCRSWRVCEGQSTPLLDGYLDTIDRNHWKADFVVAGREECRKYFLHVNPIPNASAVVFRKSAYARIGGADESLRLCGDWKLWAGMALRGKIAYVAEPLNYYRFHEASVRQQSKRSGLWTAEGAQVSSWIHRQIQPLLITAKLKVWRHWRELRSAVRNIVRSNP